MIGLLSLILAVLACVRLDDAGTAAPAPVPPDAQGLLAGPSAAAPAAAPTIVERSFDGDLLPLEDEPEVAAVFRMPLENDQRTRLEAIASRRAKAFEELLMANYDDALKVGEVLKSIRTMPAKERMAALRQLGDFRTAMAPFLDRGTFLDEARDVLDADQLSRAKAMVDEWRRAREAELAKTMVALPGPSAAGSDRERMEARMRLDALGQLARQTLQRRAQSRINQFEAITKQLDLTPEQAERVKQVTMELAVQEIQGKRERGQLTRREREQLFGELSKILDEKQRAKLLELFLGGTKGDGERGEGERGDAAMPPSAPD
jgi:hypothetical protein